MKHRLQGDKKTLASDCRMPGLTSEQPWGIPSLAGGVLRRKLSFTQFIFIGRSSQINQKGNQVMQF